MKFKILNENLFTDFDLRNDVDLVAELSNVTVDELASVVDISNIEDLYEYAMGNNIYINDIKWQQYKDLDNDNVMFLSHGSRTNLKGDKIKLHASTNNNDFGDGFYCGTSLKQAGMFVADEPESSIYIVSFKPQGLKPIRLTVSLDWMLAISYYRGIIDQYKDTDIVRNVIDKIEAADYVIAPIADNRIFELVDLFVDGKLTDLQCLYALTATYLGVQYVFTTQKAIDNIEVVDHLYLCQSEKDAYSISNSIESNTSLNKAIIAKKRYENKGQYIDEIFSKN